MPLLSLFFPYRDLEKKMHKVGKKKVLKSLVPRKIPRPKSNGKLIFHIFSCIRPKLALWEQAHLWCLISSDQVLMFGFGKVRLVDPRASQPLSAPCTPGIGPVCEWERGGFVHAPVHAWDEWPPPIGTYRCLIFSCSCSAMPCTIHECCPLMFGLPNNFSDACNQVSVPCCIAPLNLKNRSRRSAFRVGGSCAHARTACA